MSIREKNGRIIVEIYNAATGKKDYVKPADFGMDPPKNQRQAQKLERRALEARDNRTPGSQDESVASFAGRWMRDFGNTRGESTQGHYVERISAFREQHGDRTLRSISHDDAIHWANQHPSSVPVLKRMFNDAKRAKRCSDNPFSGLVVEKRKGREDITVLTPNEVDTLAELAIKEHGEEFGTEIAALIHWLAYTCMRPGEAFAARYSLLDGDIYDVRTQFNSRLRREVVPKHGSVGAIYVPEPAQRAVLNKPRRLGDDLMFRGQKGGLLYQQSLERAWRPVRAAFMATLPVGHHLHQRLALDPKDKLDPYELRHAGASYMLNDLGIEPWVIAKQLRHSDDGALVVRLYGHPTRQTAIDRLRKAFTAPKAVEINEARERKAKEA